MGGGTRKRGRPRARWLDGIKAITNCTLTELCGSAIDGNVWRFIDMVKEDMVEAEETEEDTEDRNNRRWKIRCGDP